jgi:hypothetical protein
MRSLRNLALIASLTLLTVLPAHGAPPANDDCESATPVTTFPFVTTLDLEATQPGDPQLCH